MDQLKRCANLFSGPEAVRDVLLEFAYSDLLYMILSCLGSNDLLSCREVCSSWVAVVDRVFARRSRGIVYQFAIHGSNPEYFEKTLRVQAKEPHRCASQLQKGLERYANIARETFECDDLVTSKDFSHKFIDSLRNRPRVIFFYGSKKQISRKVSAELLENNFLGCDVITVSSTPSVTGTLQPEAWKVESEGRKSVALCALPVFSSATEVLVMTRCKNEALSRFSERVISELQNQGKAVKGLLMYCSSQRIPGLLRALQNHFDDAEYFPPFHGGFAPSLLVNGAETKECAVFFRGEDIRIHSFVLDGETIGHDRMTVALTQRSEEIRKSMSVGEKFLFGLVCCCVSRGPPFHGAHNVESDAFERVFPGVPLFGFCGFGEFGTNSCAEKTGARFEIFHSFSSSFMLFSSSKIFDHVRPGNARNSQQHSAGVSDRVRAPSSANVTPTLHFSVLDPGGSTIRTSLSWADAPEFVPMSERPNAVTDGRSYAQAAGSTKVSGYSDVGHMAGACAEEELCPFAIAGECRYGEACVYVHGLICDLCETPCLHPNDEDQRKRHRTECLKRHEEDMKHSFDIAKSIDKSCGICYDVILEKPGKKADQRFGILSSCNHVFCISCIRKWRQQTENVVVPTKTARACPACRVMSDFVIPSKIWVEEKEDKEALIRTYKEEMRKKNCKHFNFGEGGCPFGNKCFYRHETRSGAKVDVGPPRRRTRVGADDEAEVSNVLMWDFITNHEFGSSFVLEAEVFDTTDSDTDSFSEPIDSYEDVWSDDDWFGLCSLVACPRTMSFSADAWDGDTDSVCDENELDHPPRGGPFSAIIPSMWPPNLKSYLMPVESESGEVHYDEFGFKIEEEDGPEQSSSPLLSTPFIEDPQERLQWLAYLEFAHGKECLTGVGGLSWDGVDSRLTQTDRLKSMIQAGIPHSLRAQVWLRISGALVKKLSSDSSYSEIVKASTSDQLTAAKQIEKDLLRTLPTNVCFASLNSPGIPKLRRILRAIAWLYPQIGYCQGMGVIVGSILLFMEEEDAFWMISAIIEDLLPASYYSQTLLGVQADQRVLREMVQGMLPELDKVLTDHDIELSLITLHWFLTLFASVVHMRVLLRIWDVLFYDGSIVMFQAALAMLKLEAHKMSETDNAADIFNLLSDIPGNMKEVPLLMTAFYEMGSQLSEVVISTQRRLQLAYLLASEGSLEAITPRSYLFGKEECEEGIDAKKLSALSSHEQVYRRQIKRSKSLLESVGFGIPDESDALKMKNVHQTGIAIFYSSPSIISFLRFNLLFSEVLVDLREAILSVGRHFQERDPRYEEISMSADYAMSSHALDHEVFARVSTNKNRRAKALLDFERHDDDELGFRRNDIITVISMKDEHCWIGELNGLRGWFPAKFVEVLDERSKQYSSAGDDTVTPLIADVVRGNLCPAIKAILEHGLKRPVLLGTVCHPWQFIEEVANAEVEKDFGSVYSRLVLCRTFRLDEDGKVLTPEELLYRCVAAANRSHDEYHAQMDVKLRSLVCMGLNEQVLHLWLEVLASCSAVVKKWYNPWSFMASPGWVQIKCELRILSQFPFNLNPDFELPVDTQPGQPMKDGLKDMLVKHHLFSWDL
ncbi:unnamed protein product [Notodromas monacha]|uniref:RING-type E3 ubiquitin transferase n=1 Tax=Notodromas monacha TaxID=399045 RepID=A0A7R9BFF6_9CRUS|nr:unnamed protein product [Notodromas monacha]CAG0914429.1 unnamed protein product [Notodromas monacha]